MRAVKGIERTAGQIYNVGGGPANTISVWAELQAPLQDLLGKLPPVEYREFRPGDQKIYVSDIRKAQQHLNWTPQVDVVEGLRRMIAQLGPMCSTNSRTTPRGNSKATRSPAQ
jgi:CDP-paratose 2-epimerase